MYTQSLSTYKMMIKINDDRDDKNILIPTEQKKYLLNMFKAEVVLYRNVNVTIQSKMCLIFTFKFKDSSSSTANIYMNIKKYIYSPDCVPLTLL